MTILKPFQRNYYHCKIKEFVSAETLENDSLSKLRFLGKLHIDKDRYFFMTKYRNLVSIPLVTIDSVNKRDYINNLKLSNLEKKKFAVNYCFLTNIDQHNYKLKGIEIDYPDINFQDNPFYTKFGIISLYTLYTHEIEDWLRVGKLNESTISRKLQKN